jgi:hypothetical protein
MNRSHPQVGRSWVHVREHVLASAALHVLNGEAPALKASTQAHLESCAQCAARLEALRTVLAGERQDGTEAADAAFPDTRLRAQRFSILERLDRVRANARVLAFPTTAAWPRSWRRDRPAMRWLAAAASVGLLVGLGAGQIVSLAPQLGFRPGVTQTAARALKPALWLHSATTTISPVTNSSIGTPQIEQLEPGDEEAFLSEMETALNTRRIKALRALDDLTPRANDAPRRRK